MTSRFNMSNILKQTVVQEKYLVSTIELGRYFGGSSMEYETMVFHCNAAGEVTDWIELYCNRYSFLQDAIEGHEATVLMYQNK
jgi:hypothetical protein